MSTRITGNITLSPTNYTPSDTDDVSSHLAGIDTALGAIDNSGRIGELFLWPADTIPSYALECDGSEISRTTYADLFTAISTTYGIGDGSTTFDLPDHRGRYLRHTDGGRGEDPDAASRTDRGDGTTGDNVGTAQGLANHSHSHLFNRNTNDLAGGGGAKITGAGSNDQTSNAGWGEFNGNDIYVKSCIIYQEP